MSRIRIVHPLLPHTYDRQILVAERSFAVWEDNGWQRHTPETTDGPPTGTVVEVLEWVSGDPTRADMALIAERHRPWPRSTLITQLQSIPEEE